MDSGARHAQDADTMMHAWCLREIAPWQAKRLPFAAVRDEFARRNAANPMQFLFHIRGGEVTMAAKAPASPDRIPVWRPPMYLRFLGDVAQQYCPDLDTDLLIHVGDGGVVLDGIPVFVFQKPLGSNALLLPDVDFLQEDFYEGKPQYADHIDYAAKRCSAVFAGAVSGVPLTAQVVRDRACPRLQSALHFRGNPAVDFRLPVIPKAVTGEPRDLLLQMGFGDPKDRLSYQQQFEHKFILSMDGFGATCSRLPITLQSNSVLLKYNSIHQLYYFDGLIPWLHYVPIASDAEVEDIVRIEAARPGTFAAIVRQANAFAAAYLTRDAAMRYTARLLREYAASFAAAGGLGAFAPPAKTEPVPAVALRVMAHIAHRGDVWFPAGAWAGADGPGGWIEGVSIEAGTGIAPQDLAYQTLGMDGALSPPVAGGVYCGSRGHAAPLAGLGIRLSGVSGARGELRYTARFADGAVVGPLTDGAICRSPTGAKLLSLRVCVQARAAG